MWNSFAEEAIELFKKYNPKTVEEALQKTKLGFTCVGVGVFRAAYLTDWPVIAKFPIQDKRPELNIAHSRDEMKNIKWIQRTKKLEPLWGHLPEFYYWNNKSGVSLMPCYDLLEDNLNVHTLAQYKELVKKLKLIDYGRVDKDQIGIKEDGTLVCMDFGHIGEKRRQWNKKGKSSNCLKQERSLTLLIAKYLESSFTTLIAESPDRSLKSTAYH
jgi:hypothetical protein